MKQLQRILSAALALILMVTLWSPAYALEEAGIAMTMTASQSGVRVGETVEITIGVNADFSTRGSGMTVCYDGEKLELDLENSVAAVPFRIDPVTVNGQSALRISFLPGLDAATFSAKQPLAVLRFKAMAVCEYAAITMETAYLYDTLLSEISLTKAESVAISIDPSEEYIPVTGINLDMTELTLEEGEMAALKATIDPIGASDPAVIWTSSDEHVVKVSGGAVKAISEGQATITAITNDGGFTASCTVTVLAPDAGYTVSLPAEKSSVLGSVLEIPVTISNEDGKTGYNAFDIGFAYDPEVLEFVNTGLSDVTVTAGSGTIQILDYGEQKDPGSIPVTLMFRTLKMGTGTLTITDARVDNSGNAVLSNASLAATICDTTRITVTGYPVTLPDGFDGPATAVPGESYTFRVADDWFDYQVKATVGGKDVKLTQNSDGSYTVPADQVTGEIVVTATKTGRMFAVTLGTDMTGAATAQHGVDYTARLNRDEDYSYSVQVTIGGKNYTGYGVSTDRYTIPGADITGNIVFTVTKTLLNEPGPSNPTEPCTPNPTEPSTPGTTEPSKPSTTQPTVPPTTKPSTSGSTNNSGQQQTKHSVKFSGSGAGAAQGNATIVVHDSSYTLKLKQEEGYEYTVSYIMGGKPAVALQPVAGGTYVLSKVTAPVEFVIEKTLHKQVSVQKYLTLNDKTVYLVQAVAKPDSGKFLTFNGETMYYSEHYGTWVCLVIMEEEMDPETAAQKLEVASGNRKVLARAVGDVDLSGTADLTDVQLIWNLYNGKYTDFGGASMATFLNADVNGDGKLDTRDCAAAVYGMTNHEEA